jgi:hypothetical protein
LKEDFQLVEIRGRKMYIPDGEECVGFVGDNKTEVREFEIIDKALFGFDFKLDLKLKDYIGIVDLEKIVQQDRIILRWEIKKEHLPTSGMIFAQLRAFNEEEDVWHSDEEFFMVSSGINATEHFTSPLPSEFEQIEQQVTAARNETVLAKGIVLEKANEVAENTQIVSDKTEIVLQKTGEVEVNAQKVAQNTESAIESANISAQALSDLLAMIGTDIATLTDGKLTPSQIPALSIINNITVKDRAEMLALDVQKGDSATVIDDGDGYSRIYQLREEPAHIYENWQLLTLPTNFADYSGHAYTADEAVNASMINGHRLVLMESTQFNRAKSSGTIEEGTFYAVVPDGTLGGE